MNDLAHMLLGAALVVLGVLAAGIADRIRGIKLTRERASSSTRKQIDTEPGNPTEIAMSRDVIKALVTAGYSKAEATEATCSVPSSATATMESWIRAALGAAMKRHDELRKVRQGQS